METTDSDMGSITQKKKRRMPSLKLVRNFVAIGAFSFGYNFITTAEYVHFREIFEAANFTSSILISILLASAIGSFCLGIIIGGIVNDSMRTKYGQRAPAILLGGLVASLFFLFVPLITEFVNNTTTAFVLLLIIFIIANLGLGTAFAPWIALVPDLFNREERTYAGIAINVFSAVGAITALLIFSSLIDHNLSWIIWIVIGVVFLCSVLVTVKQIPKTNPDQVTRLNFKEIISTPKQMVTLGGKPWIIILLVSLFWSFGSHLIETGVIDSLIERFQVKDMQASLASNIVMGGYVVLLFIPLTFLMRKIRKVHSSIIASVIYCIFCLALALMSNFNVIYFIMIFGGAGNLLLSTMQIALPADFVPKGKEASFLGIFFVFGTITKPIATLVQGLLIENKEANIGLANFGGYPWTFIIAAIVFLVAIILLLTITKSDCFELKIEKRKNEVGG
ncbi:MAG: MFS transporter [Candidatus Heimdallarchaeota archaeon]